MMKLTHDLILIAIASFLGSWHCAAMCGSFSAMASGESQSYFKLSLYQVGRLISYIFLTSLVFILGKPVGLLVEKYDLKWVGTGLLIFLMCFWLYFLIFNKKTNLKPPMFVVQIFRWIRQKKGYSFPLLLGLSTTLLPCIWLYGFIALAAAKTSYIESVLTISAFWLGTLPSLIFVQIFAIRITSRVKNYLKPIAIAILILVSSLNALSRFQLQLNTEKELSIPEARCH